MKDSSFEVPTVGLFKKAWAQSAQPRLDAENDVGRAHDFGRSKALHPDWRESNGIALPTVEELHYANYFLNRAAERRLKEFSPTNKPNCVGV